MNASATRFAASKKKGMWMGGNLPLGYDPNERTLVINPAEAVNSPACAGSRRRPTVSGFGRNAAQANGTERGGKSFSRGHLYTLLWNPIYTGQIAHKAQVHPGQQPALIDDESWSAVRDQLAANMSDHRRRAKAAEPSLLAGLLVDARGERLTSSHAVKNGRRYRYYISAALITDAGTDRAQGWRLAAREIEEAVIRILADALANPASLVEPFGVAGMPSDQVRKLLNRTARMAAALGGLPGERAKLGGSRLHAARRRNQIASARISAAEAQLEM